MSAGNIQLAAIGQQDALLTGAPSVTHFSGVFKRHTPFVLEAYEVPFLGERVLYDSTATCRIPYKGDLVRGLTVKMNLPYLNDPGNNFSYPIEASSTFIPYFFVNGGTTRKSVQPTSAFYSTLTPGDWLPSTDDTQAGYYADVSETLNKFIFSNCASIECDPEMVVFWGLDPRGFDSVDAEGRFVYRVSGTRTSELTFEQSGWDRVSAIPPESSRSGLFMSVPGVTGYMPTEMFGPNTYWLKLTSWIIQGSSGIARRTNGGLVTFLRKGLYHVTFRTTLPINQIRIGTTKTDIHPTLALTSYSKSYTWSVSAGQPTIVQINVDDIFEYYYFDVTMLEPNPKFDEETFISIGPSDQHFRLSTALTLPATSPTPLRVGQFVMPVGERSDILTVDTVNDTFRFEKYGVFLVTCIFSAPTALITGVAYGEYEPGTSTYKYRYDTNQSTDPTINFSFPIVVTSLETSFFLDIFHEGGGDLLPGTTITFIQQASDDEDSVAFTQNGVLFRPKQDFSPTEETLNLEEDFDRIGTSNDISVTDDGSLTFVLPGIHYLHMVILATPQIRSISIGLATYTFTLGTVPPHTVKLPFFVNSGDVLQVKVVADEPITSIDAAMTYLIVTPFSSTESFTRYGYFDSVGTYAIKNADLYIGGQLIQSLQGEMIEIWNDLNVPYENQPALKLLTGKGDTSNVYAPSYRTYYTTLPFYFYGNPELSLPLAAIARQDIELRVTFRDFGTINNAGAVTSDPLETTVIVEYVYLDDTEIQWIQNNRLEYIITQTQYFTTTLPKGFKLGVFDMPFINPVKELFFVLQKAKAEPYDYSDTGLVNLGLTFNNNSVFTRDAADLGTLVPYMCYNITPMRKFFMYSFAKDPVNPRPTGQVNFSRIRQKVLELNLSGDANTKIDMRVYCNSYNVLRVENGLAGILFNV
jgi:hypothetical protein